MDRWFAGKALPFIGGALVAGGLALLAFALWPLVFPPPAPYSYALLAEGKGAEFPDLGLGEQANLVVRKYEVRAEGADRPVAVFHVGDKGAGPVRLDWTNRVAEPVFALGGAMSEVATLARAVAKHATAESVVLGWWDTSRQLELLVGAKVLFNENLLQPILLPTAWSGRRDLIEAQERAFWQAPARGATEPAFAEYIDALLSDETAGAAKLRQLTAGSKTFLVVHLTDAYKVGALDPRRFGIGYKDFPDIGGTHALINQVKGWLREQGYESYAAEKRDEAMARVYFLTDAASANTLIARLLPFSTSNPFDLAEFALVYQHRGYWVYELATAAGRN